MLRNALFAAIGVAVLAGPVRLASGRENCLPARLADCPNPAACNQRRDAFAACNARNESEAALANERRAASTATSIFATPTQRNLSDLRDTARATKAKYPTRPRTAPATRRASVPGVSPPAFPDACRLTDSCNK